MQQKLRELQGKMDKSTVLVRDFNTSFSIIDRTERWKIGMSTVNRTTLATNLSQLSNEPLLLNYVFPATRK